MKDVKYTPLFDSKADLTYNLQFLNLCSAIIKQAEKDFKSKRYQQEVEEFCSSDWYELLQGSCYDGSHYY